MREVESEKERETAGCSAQAKPLRGFLTNLPWSGLMPEWGNCAHLAPRGILLRTCWRPKSGARESKHQEAGKESRPVANLQQEGGAEGCEFQVRNHAVSLSLSPNLRFPPHSPLAQTDVLSPSSTWERSSRLGIL